MRLRKGEDGEVGYIPNRSPTGHSCALRAIYYLNHKTWFTLDGLPVLGYPVYKTEEEAIADAKARWKCNDSV